MKSPAKATPLKLAPPSKTSPPKSKLVKLEAQALKIHPHAQRNLLPTKLKQLKQDLDLDAIGVLHAVEYEVDGVAGIWIIDGQHRWRALMDHGFGEWVVEVKIHLDVKDDARASELFLKLNNRAAVSPFDKFDNALKAGYADEVDISRIAKDRQLKLDRGAGDGKICCVTILKTVYGHDKGAALSATLDTLLAAWGRTASAVEGRLVEGVGLLFKTYNGKIDRPALIKKLSKYPGGASGLVGDARGMRQFRHGSVARCLADRTLELYNNGRKVKLDPL